MTLVESLFGIIKISSFAPNTLLISKNGLQVSSLALNLGIDMTKPTPVYGLPSNIKKVVSGISHTFVLASDLSIYTFGYNLVRFFIKLNLSMED